MRRRHNVTHVTKMANPKCNYQFMFSAKLVFCLKSDTSNFIYTTKNPQIKPTNKKPHPNRKKKNYQRKEKLHTYFSRNSDTQKFNFPFVLLIEDNFSYFSCSFHSFIMPLLSIWPRCSYFEAWLFTRLFFGPFLFMSYQNPFWFLCTFPCGVLGNIQSVYYNLGTVTLKENINIVAELSATHYAIFTDLYFY